ncbi:MAG: lysylphosphatidylglycerol synthase transmembrane domain-containing protein [Spirochaetota bacterium]
MSSRQELARRLFRYAVIFFIIVGVLLAVSNVRNLASIFGSISPVFLGGAVGCALVVHLLEGLFLYSSLRVYGERLPLGVALRYALVINSIGYLVSLGGVTQFATQVHVLDHYGISTRKATVTRVLHLLFFNAVFDLMLAGGFAAILTGGGSGPYLRLVQAVTGLFLLVKPVLYLVLFWRSFRERVVGLVTRLLDRLVGLFTRRARLNREAVASLFDEFQEGASDFSGRGGLLVLVGVITLLVWVFWIGAAWMSFLAVRSPLRAGTLVVGFAVGHIVGVLSMVPGGIGTLEGSSALAYAALGVPLATALSALLVYRMTYYVVPFVLALPFYFGLKRRFHAAPGDGAGAGRRGSGDEEVGIRRTGGCHGTNG